MPETFVLKNYKLRNKNYEEFSYVKIRYNDEVFQGLPICLVPFGKSLKRPVLVPSNVGYPTVMEDTTLAKELEKTILCSVIVNPDGTLSPAPKDTPAQRIRISKETNISQYSYLGNQLVFVGTPKTDAKPSTPPKK